MSDTRGGNVDGPHRKRDRDDDADRMPNRSIDADEEELQEMAGTLGRGDAHSLSSLSKRVAEICRFRGKTSYNEVADELVLEILNASGPSSEEKNIRRRVYDAFNVLIAVGMIEKDGKKEVIWRGLGMGSNGDGQPSELGSQLRDARLENERRLQAVLAKQQELQGLLDSKKVISHLVATNPVRQPSEESSDMALHIPFMLIRAKPEATVEVKVSDTMREVDFKFTGAPFALNDDAYVIRQMAASLPKQLNELSSASS